MPVVSEIFTIKSRLRHQGVIVALVDEQDPRRATDDFCQLLCVNKVKDCVDLSSRKTLPSV